GYEVGGRVAALLSPKDYLVAGLTGVAQTDAIDATYILLADPLWESWQEELAAELGLPPAWLPPIVAPTTIVGQVTPEAAAVCGVPTETPVVSGAPDGSVGLGLLLGRDRHAIANIAGTTDVLGRLIPKPSVVGEGALM